MQQAPPTNLFKDQKMSIRAPRRMLLHSMNSCPQAHPILVRQREARDIWGCHGEVPGCEPPQAAPPAALYGGPSLCILAQPGVPSTSLNAATALPPHPETEGPKGREINMECNFFSWPELRESRLLAASRRWQAGVK